MMRMHERKSVRRLNGEKVKTVDLVRIVGTQRKEATKAKSKGAGKNDVPGKIGEKGRNPASSLQKISAKPSSLRPF